MNANVVICKRVREVTVPVEILYFNCIECDTPLMNGKSRSSGHCGCTLAAEKPVRKKAEKLKYGEAASGADLQRRIDQVVAAAEHEEQRVVANVPSSY